MSATAYEAGLAAFRESLAEAEAEKAGQTWKAGGRATKAWPNKENRDWWYSEGPNMVHAYYNWRQQNPNLQVWHTPEGLPAIEFAANVTLPDGTILKAYIDRVFEDKQTGQQIIVDLKTGKPPASSLQLAVYRLALEQTFGAAPRYGAYWMARQSTFDKVHDLDQYPTSIVARWMTDIAKAIKLGLFVPNITSMCNYCGVQQHCYVFNPELTPPHLHLTVENNEGKVEE